MEQYEEPSQGLDFKDRKVGLVIFGILQILLGAFCGLMVPLMILGMIVSTIAADGGSEAMSFKMMIPGVLVYLLAAIWFITMGIGSIKTRRWARALILVSSWVWLISGVCGLIFVLFFVPNMYGEMEANGQMPPGMAVIVKFVMMAVMTVVYVIIPGALVLFYRSRHVKATCEYRDPNIRWTDKCPLPVLAMSLVCAVWAASMLWMGAFNWAIPFFGDILSGISGMVLVLILVLLLAYTAWGTYKLDMKAWWCALLVIVGWFLSTIITFSRGGLLTYYEKMDFPPQQLELMKKYDMMSGPTMGIMMAFWVIIFILYLMYIRKYFVAASRQKTPSHITDLP
jgi:hypothetical protein